MTVTKKDFPKRLDVYIDEEGEEKYFIAVRTDNECATTAGGNIRFAPLIIVYGMAQKSM